MSLCLVDRSWRVYSYYSHDCSAIFVVWVLWLLPPTFLLYPNICDAFKDDTWCNLSKDLRLIFILQQGSNVGAADAASAIHNIIEVLNQSLGKTSTRQSQNQGQRSGQCQTVDQEMARFQLAVMTENNDSYYLQCSFVHM